MLKVDNKYHQEKQWHHSDDQRSPVPSADWKLYTFLNIVLADL